ncbi:MAG: hypothetical protein ACD_20C00350G0007 [uncultured bacterium]|nr:MAG: hypothetical protein ACD_20C00350G0007 [uncultured bacterium]
MNRENKISVISLIIVIGFVLSIFYHYILGVYLNLGYPFNTFLFIPQDRFMDFFNACTASRDLNPYLQTDILVNYFPFAFVIIYLFTIMPLNISFTLFVSFFILYFFYYNYINLKSAYSNINKIVLIRNTFIFSFMTYPFLITIDRGNFEILLFILMSLSVYFYLKKDFLKSILFLAVPAAMKLYPITLAILFLSDKKYREFFYTIFIAGSLNILSLFLFKNGVIMNIGYFLGNLYKANHGYIIGNLALGHGTSLYGVLKIIIFKLYSSVQIKYLSGFIPLIVLKLQGMLTPDVISNALRIYTAVVLILFLLITLYVIFIEKQFWKKVALLIFSAIIFTPMSGGYKLLHLFIPLWLFINDKNISRYDLFYVISFGLLLIPKDYLYFAFDRIYTISIILDPTIITAMMVMIIFEGIKNRKSANIIN